MPHSTLPYRQSCLLVLAALVALGAFSRIAPIGAVLWDKYLGDVIYAAVFYFGLCLIIGRSFLIAKSCVSALYVSGIELFQLTSIPLQLNHSPDWAVRLFAYLVLGSRFSWWDMLAYAVGIGLAILADRILSGSYTG